MMVWPSGVALSSISDATIPPALGRLSTTTCCPQLSDIFWPTRRPRKSIALPAETVTSMRMGLVGNFSCASPAPAASNSAAAIVKVHVTFIISSSVCTCLDGASLSLGRNADVLHQLLILHEFCLQQRLKLFRCAACRFGALAQESLVGVGGLEDIRYVLVQLLHNTARRLGRSHDAEPTFGLKTRQSGLRDRRHIGQRRRALGGTDRKRTQLAVPQHRHDGGQRKNVHL